MKILLFVRLFFESVNIAFQSLRSNVLRTVLSLLGVTIGIIAIIAVFSMVDSLEKKVRGSVEELGDNVVFVQKWPWLFGGDYPWWKYINRPEPSFNDFKAIKKNCTKSDALAMIVNFKRPIQHKNKSIDFASGIATTYSYNQVRDFEIEEGRYFSALEMENGNNVAIIGFLVKQYLFQNLSPIGKKIKVGNKTVTVIGVFKEEGESLMGTSSDELVHIPLNFVRKFIDLNTRSHPDIIVKGKSDVTIAELKDELTGILRSARKLKPKSDDNFALNQTSMLTRAFDDLFKLLNLAGLIIGMFSIVVGGFSIANIMFVSVKERINIIGIQKSLGAKNSFILFQFLTESVVLCVLGGTIGLLIVFGIIQGVNHAMDYDIVMSLNNILKGLGISVVIGIASGLLPALNASQLNPVDAIRAK